jgi:hypothetical protein
MLTVRLADELVETLKEKAEADAIPVTELVTRLLRRGLSESPSQPSEAELKLLEERLHQLENRLEQSTADLQGRLERTVGRFETLENLFVRTNTMLARGS